MAEPRHIVLAGAGHAHLTVLKNLAAFKEAGCRVTVVSPVSYHYYSGMGPGMLAGTFAPAQCRFHVKKMAEQGGAAFVSGAVSRVDAKARKLRLDSGAEIAYDICSFNVGSRIDLGPVNINEQNVFTVKPIEGLFTARQRITDMLRKRPEVRLLVAGGGAAGAELAGALLRLGEDEKKPLKLTLLAGGGFLSSFPEKFRAKARKNLVSRGAEIIDGAGLAGIRNGRASLTDGRDLAADAFFLAWGVRMQDFFARSGLPVDKDGSLLVNEHLQCTAHPELFGGGDCVSLAGHPIAKVGVYAVRQNPILFANLLAAAQGSPLIPFVPQEKYLLILNMGDGRGVLIKDNWIFSGKLCFALKKYIDLRFMKTFQTSGELDA